MTRPISALQLALPLATLDEDLKKSEFLTVLGLSKWAEMDEPFGVQKGMGEEGYQRFVSKIRPLVVETEYNVYRFQRDLSYLPVPSGSGAGN
jgi:hypothetical protein